MLFAVGSVRLAVAARILTPARLRPPPLTACLAPTIKLCVSPEPPSQPAVELKSVRKAFAGRTILDSVDLAILRGEVFALVGPSGSGKSTLLKMVSGIDSPDEGQVLLAGRDVTQTPPYRRPVHTVFQNYALFPHLDVAGNVAFPLRVAGVPRSQIASRVMRALDWVGLGAFASRRVATLSGGERQRVALARALIDEPECVLLDEPLSALDPHLRAQTLELLKEIQARLHVTYLYVTHDREEALRAATRVGVLNQGRLEQIGPPEQVYRQPRTPFVASFIGPINWLVVEREEHEGRPTLALPGGDRFEAGDLPHAFGGAKRLRLGIRPESIVLDDCGLLRGEVISRQFSGASIAVKLRTAGGATLLAELPGDRAAPSVGDVVGISWRPSSVHWFAEATP